MLQDKNIDGTGPNQAVLGLDNVPLELPVASIGNRSLAAALDHLLLAALSMAFFSGLVVTSALTDWGGGWMLALAALGGFLLNWGYFTVFEIALGGQTPGKRALSLRVVTRDGGSAAATTLIVRNLLRVIDNLIGLVLIAIDPLARRLGDRLAGTLVVHERQTTPEIVLSRVPQGWGAAEVALAESFLERCKILEPRRKAELAVRIINWIRRDDPSFLTAVEPCNDPAETIRRAFGPERL